MNAIEFRDVVKRYRKGDSVFSMEGYFNAVDGVTFDVGFGESVGLVGRNGAGKTTVMQLAAGITAPSSGAVVTRGKTVPLIAMEGCLNHQFNAADNVRFLLQLHGWSAPRIEAAVLPVLEFAGLTEFPEMPVKHFSSGMRARLAFSVTTRLPVDTLLLDEVLSVGDEEFKEKCREHIDGLIAAGRTVLFSSHSLDEIERICSRALWLDKGRVAMDGDSKSVVAAYRESVRKTAGRPDAAAVSGHKKNRFPGEPEKRA